MRGWLGVSIQPVTPELAKSLKLSETTGALVSSVTDGSPAAKAGLKPGDVILEFNGERVARADRLPSAVATTPVGREVPLAVVRDGKSMKLTVKVGEQAESKEAASEPAKVPAKLGLTVEPVTPRLAREMGLRDEQGVIVREVEADSPAAEAGAPGGRRHRRGEPAGGPQRRRHAPPDRRAREGHAGADARPPGRGQPVRRPSRRSPVQSGRARGSAPSSRGGAEAPAPAGVFALLR